MSPDTEDEDQPGPTESATIGTAREFMRTVGNFLPGEDGDELAAEVDRVVESLAGPHLTADDVDAAANEMVRTIRAQRERQDQPIIIVPDDLLADADVDEEDTADDAVGSYLPPNVVEDETEGEDAVEDETEGEDAEEDEAEAETEEDEDAEDEDAEDEDEDAEEN